MHDVRSLTAAALQCGLLAAPNRRSRLPFPTTEQLRARWLFLSLAQRQPAGMVVKLVAVLENVARRARARERSIQSHSSQLQIGRRQLPILSWQIAACVVATSVSRQSRVPMSCFGLEVPPDPAASIAGCWYGRSGNTNAVLAAPVNLVWRCNHWQRKRHALVQTAL